MAGSVTLADILAAHLRAARLPLPIPEHRFAPPRRWRFDFAWPEHRIALEVEGGVWTGGRHTRPAGFLKDVEKYNRAVVLQWGVLRCTPADVRTGAVLALLTEVLKEERHAHPPTDA